MAVLVLALLFLGMSGFSDASWCVCRSDVSEATLQKTLDYSCGAGADCSPIHQGSACFEPNNVKAHCSYAVNSYYQKKGQAAGSCDFNSAATVTGSDPSGGGCTYPASSSAAGTSTPTSTTSPPGSTSTMAPPGSTTGTGTSAGTTGTGFTTPNSGGIMGGGFGGSGLGPSGSGINPDPNDGGWSLLQSSTRNLLLVLCLWSSSLVFWWG